MTFLRQEAFILFLVSGFLFTFGNGVAFLVMLWKYPEVLTAIIFISFYLFVVMLSLAVLIFAMVTFAYDNRMQLMVVKKLAPQNGIEIYAPACVQRVLQRTIFENLARGHRRFVVPMLDVVRLMILTTTELTEAENNRLLQEMQNEFRYAVFEHKTFEVCPESVQWLLRGNRYKEHGEESSRSPHREDDDDMATLMASANSRATETSEASRETLPDDATQRAVTDPVSEDLPEDAPQRSRTDSVREHLEIIVKEMKTRQDAYGLVPAIMAEKASEMSVRGTMRFMFRWTLHRVGCDDVSKTWDRIEKQITTEPKRWIFYIPWVVARRTLKVGGSVIGWNPEELIGTMPQLERSASPQQSPAAKAEELEMSVSSPLPADGASGQKPCSSKSTSFDTNEEPMSLSMSSVE